MCCLGHSGSPLGVHTGAGLWSQSQGSIIPFWGINRKYQTLRPELASIGRSLGTTLETSSSKISPLQEKVVEEGFSLIEIKTAEVLPPSLGWTVLPPKEHSGPWFPLLHLPVQGPCHPVCGKQLSGLSRPVERILTSLT